MSTIPEMLDYAAIKPRGLTTEFETMRFSPLTSFTNYTMNDIIRIWIPRLKGYWDPYKSYIEVEIEVDPAEFPIGTAQQLDNSASSLLSELRVLIDSTEVERIQEYDSLAALLHDVAYTPSDKFGEEYEGTGYAAHTSEGVNIDARERTSAIFNGGYNGAVTTHTGRAVSATSVYSIPTYTRGYMPGYSEKIDASQGHIGIAGLSTTVGGGQNMQTDGSYLGGVPRKIPREVTGVVLADNGSIDERSTPPGVRTFVNYGSQDSYSKNVDISVYGGATKFGEKNLIMPRSFVEDITEGTLYGLQATDAYNFSLFGPTAYTAPTPGVNIATTQVFSPNYTTSRVINNGYSQAFSEELSNGSFEPIIAPAHEQTWIHKGQFLQTPIATNKRVFQIPIISALLGVLIPAESYKLIPMEALENLMLEFRLNEYAMFTSGYAENFAGGAGFRGDTPMTAYNQVKRDWMIRRFEIFGAIYTFDDFVDSLVRQKLETSGITLSSNGWDLGPRFSLASNSLLENSWQINAGYESLKMLCFRIQSDDYKKWQFCRKHYYYSGNVTSLQIKIANTYIPPQPIEGHAGCILPEDQDENNAPYIIELHKAFGELFNVGENTYINSTNFAVNDRPYDPSNTLPYLVNGTFSTQIGNIDTTNSFPLFHENRCVGRALYAFDLESLPHEPDVISGLNTLKWRPFEVVIDTDTSTPFPRDATLMYWLNYDVIFELKMDGPPAVYGKG